MITKISFLIASAFLIGFAAGSCPEEYTAVGNYCYKLFSEVEIRPRAQEICRADGGHLWSFETFHEFYEVLNTVIYPSSTFNITMKSGSGAAPSFWTDGINLRPEGACVWETSMALIEFDYEMGLYENACCSGQGCPGGGLYNPGDCFALGRVSFGAADSGYGLLGCDCDQGSTRLKFVCETNSS